MLFAAESTVSIWVALIALVAAAVTAGSALLGKFKEVRTSRIMGDQTRELTVIHETTDGLKVLVIEQRAELIETRAELKAAREEIVSLRGQVAEMREQLAISLRHHEECEAAREDDREIIDSLRQQLKKGQT